VPAELGIKVRSTGIIADQTGNLPSVRFTSGRESICAEFPVLHSFWTNRRWHSSRVNEMSKWYRQRSIEIREATTEESESIHLCLQDAFEPYRGEYTSAAFTDTVPSPAKLRERMRRMKLLVAVRQDKILGTVSGAVINAEEGHLRGMAVCPEYRGKGVAERLLLAIEEQLRARGCSWISLDTTRPLLAAIRFYEKNGYKASGRVTDFHGMPLIEYRKTL
jgi:GNAT superfamily N-acetyltransferase